MKTRRKRIKEVSFLHFKESVPVYAGLKRKSNPSVRRVNESDRCTTVFEYSFLTNAKDKLSQFVDHSNNAIES